MGHVGVTSLPKCFNTYFSRSLELVIPAELAKTRKTLVMCDAGVFVETEKFVALFVTLNYSCSIFSHSKIECETDIIHRTKALKEDNLKKFSEAVKKGNEMKSEAKRIFATCPSDTRCQ